MAKTLFASCPPKPTSSFPSITIRAVAPPTGSTKLVKPINVAETISVKKCEPVLVRPLAKTHNSFYLLSTIDENMVFPFEALYSFKAEEIKRTDNFYEVIKESLAQMLVHFYPLAGRLAKGRDGKYMVNCTGEGVYFVEAVSDHELDELGDISTPNPAKLRRFVHFDEAKDFIDMPLFTVQVTTFKCGGFILGVVGNHCTMDGIALCTFMNSWGETARGLPLSVSPFIDRSILKGRKISPIKFLHGVFTKINLYMISKKGDVSHAVTIPKDEQTVYKSIEFSRENLVKLKGIVIKQGITRVPTNFEMLTAFIWHALIKSRSIGRSRKTKLYIPVNARRKLRAFPDGYFGNCLGIGYSICNTEELMKKPLYLLVKQVQEAIQMVTVENLQLLTNVGEATGLTISYKNAFVFSDLSRMPFYEVDFGWGVPKQFGMPALPKDFAYLLPQQTDRNKIQVVLGLPLSSLELFEEIVQF